MCGPFIVGSLKHATGNYTAAVLLLSGVNLLAAGCTAVVLPIIISGGAQAAAATSSRDAAETEMAVSCVFQLGRAALVCGDDGKGSSSSIAAPLLFRALTEAPVRLPASGLASLQHGSRV
jgi:hypothetical protein